jgi:hypothetical protein
MRDIQYIMLVTCFEGEVIRKADGEALRDDWISSSLRIV